MNFHAISPRQARNAKAVDKIKKPNDTKGPDWCDFSKDSTIRDALLSKIKKEYFHPHNKPSFLTNDELGLVNAAAKPEDPKQSKPSARPASAKDFPKI